MKWRKRKVGIAWNLPGRVRDYPQAPRKEALTCRTVLVMRTIVVSGSIVVSVFAAGCTTEIEPVVPEGALLLTVSDDADEREALGAVRIAERDDGMQIALTIAELVAPGD